MKATTTPARAAVLVLSLLSFLSGFAQEKSQPATHGINVAHLDPAVKPGDNFYEYANGGWLKQTEIPPDRPSVGVFSTLFDLANKRTVGLIEEAAKSNPPAGSNARKIADLFNSYMDEGPREEGPGAAAAAFAGYRRHQGQAR